MTDLVAASVPARAMPGIQEFALPVPRMSPAVGPASKIPFGKPTTVGRELEYIAEAIRNGTISGGGPFMRRCEAWLEQALPARRALLAHSCTAALEMAAILSGVGPGDEVIMPSFTFSATATAFVLRGATPVFVDIRPDTLNIDERLIEAAITPRTRVIVPVHYAGLAACRSCFGDVGGEVVGACIAASAA